jgi:hypothetical protein
MVRVYKDEECDEFTIKVRMKKRWTPHFLAMLHTMEYYGNLGCSRMLTIFSDGDGDFRPNFEWSRHLCCHAKPVKDEHGNLVFDAG